ncbi:hypothetical protein ACWGJP_05865 [Microbacterium sp. NPDC055903]
MSTVDQGADARILRPSSLTDPVERIVSIDITHLVTAALGAPDPASDGG